MALDPRAFIREKRDGHTHDPEQLQAFIAACASKAIPDYQASAWLMAAFLRGLHDRRRQRVLAPPLQARREPERLGVVRSVESDDGDEARPPLGEGAGLVDDERVDAVPLQPIRQRAAAKGAVGGIVDATPRTDFEWLKQRTTTKL